MARKHYRILSHGLQWRLEYPDGQSVHYGTQAQAIRRAVDLAHEDGRAGHDAQVIIQGQNGQWRTEWTYGHDPYPPKG
jgi:hypothetical protein